MSAILPPVPSAKPKLPAHLIRDGILSEPQIESIIYAEEAHSAVLAGTHMINKHYDICSSDEEETTEVAFRRGWFLGDGTGCGKGRQIAGIILSNFAQGRKRAIWLSKNDKLIEDARRDWQALGGDPAQIVSLSRFKQGSSINLKSGILFVTYGTLRTSAKQGKISRVQQIVEWAGRDFDGVIAFDESHALANLGNSTGLMGKKAASQQAQAGLKLQHALSNARVIYVSATGATEIGNLAYTERLGLWGKDTAFVNADHFISSIDKGGIAAMEVISRDMKAMGLYTARSLSYDGVEVDMLTHYLTPEQIDIYDTWSGAYSIIHRNLHAALEETNIKTSDKMLNGRAAGSVMSVFESCKQRFFAHLLTSMKCPTLVRAIEDDLAHDRAPVIQIVSTSEALLQRKLDDIPSEEWSDLNIDVTPREYVMEYLMQSFPTQLYELYQDDNVEMRSRPVFDHEGKAVQNMEAIERRDALVTRLASLPAIPSALDQIIQHFGHDQVAEVTGRSIRLVMDDGKLCVQKRSPSVNLSETHAFMNGDKQMLIFSDAGGTGRSYHADLNCNNQRKRVHYLLEPGWRADNAVQGLGRTNRTNQASAPIFRPVSTNVRGETRFLSTIAKRLDSLGAITKGQRETGGQGLFRAEDNLESNEARQAIRTLFIQINDEMIPGCSLDEFEDMTGLKISDLDNLPPTPRFLNRLLALPISIQNLLFDQFTHNLEEHIAYLKESGKFNIGIETLIAESFTVQTTQEVHIDQTTGAKSFTWLITEKQRNNPTSFDHAVAVDKERTKFWMNEQSGNVAISSTTTNKVCLDTGASLPAVRLVRPTSSIRMSLTDLQKTSWEECSQDQCQRIWQEQFDAQPEFINKEFMMVTGALLPIWNSIGGSDMKIYRLRTDEGHVLLGRKLEGAEIRKFQTGMGLNIPPMTAEQIWNGLQNRESYRLAQDLRLKFSRCMGVNRIEVVCNNGGERILDHLESLGCFSEIIQYRRRMFVPNTDEAIEIIAAIVRQFPLSE